MSRLFTSCGQSTGISFNFSISLSNEYFRRRLISFRIDWFDLLAVQETLEHCFQHHSLKVSILQCSAFFIVRFSHPYMTTGKTIALTICTFVGKVMSRLFNISFHCPPHLSCLPQWLVKLLQWPSTCWLYSHVYEGMLPHQCLLYGGHGSPRQIVCNAPRGPALLPTSSLSKV